MVWISDMDPRYSVSAQLKIKEEPNSAFHALLVDLKDGSTEHFM